MENASLDPTERARLARIVALHGEGATVTRLAIPRNTLARALGGLGLRRGTVLAIRAALAADEAAE